MTLLLILVCIPVVMLACWWEQLLGMILNKYLDREDDRPAQRRGGDGG